MFRWYFYCFSKYLTFKGRASRAEYWSFTLINIVILFCLALFGQAERMKKMNRPPHRIL